MTHKDESPLDVVLQRRVRNRDAADGVHPDLLALLDAWDKDGTFDVIVAPNGGLRTDEDTQANLASGGLSRATTLKTTPHGRGAALDVWPVGFNAYGPTLSEQPESMAQFTEFGAFAKARGLVWGGDWTNFKQSAAQKDGIDPGGDWPHVELASWTSLPFPSNYTSEA